MKPRTLVVLSALVALLALVVVLDRPRAGGDADTRTRVLAGFDPTRVKRVRLGAPGRPELVLERRGASLADFVLTAPLEAPAERAAVSDLLGTLEYLSWRRRVPASAAAARGLTAGSARVLEVEDLVGARVRVLIGKSEPALERTWMAREGAAEHLLVDDYFARALERSADDLRRRDPLPVPPERADVVIEAGAARLELRGTPACVVVDAGGACARADGERVARLLRRLADVRLARFLGDGDVPADGVPELRVQAAGHELRVYGACPGAPELRAVRSELGAGCVRADMVAALAGEAAEPLAWVDCAVFPLGLRDLRRVTLARGAARTVLEREGGAWQRVAPGARAPVDDEAFAAWWRDLASFAATQVVRVPPLPGPPADAATLELVPVEGAPILLWLAAPPPGAEKSRVLVRRAGEPVALLVHADVARYLDPDPVQFAARAVLDFEASALRGLEIDRGDGVVEKAARGASLDDWSLSAPLAVPADADALAALRDAAAHLHAVRAVAARPLPAHGLEPARVRLTFVLDPPPTTPDAPPTRRTLALGALTLEGECHARAGDGPVFLLDATSCAALAAPLATRELWPERDPAALELGAARYERNGPGWYGPDGARLPDRVAATLAQAVHALGAPAEILGYGTPARATRLTVTWTDGATSTLLVGRNEYGLEGRAVRYRLPTEVCAAFAGLCK